MKKKSANFLMVPATAFTVMGGLLLAFVLRKQASDHLGSSYQIAPIPDNCLAEGGDKICTISIVWCCTCTGLGADVGEIRMGG